VALQKSKAVQKSKSTLMNQLVAITDCAPALVRAAGERAQTRFWEFFVSNIRNPHAPRLWPLDCGIPRLVRAARPRLDRRRGVFSVSGITGKVPILPLAARKKSGGRTLSSEVF
jgi:hypothetical protein